MTIHSQPIAPFMVSVVTSTRPLGKRFTFDAAGTLQKESLGVASAGSIERRTMEDLGAFAALRKGLTDHQALMYGVSEHENAQLTTQGRLRRASSSEPIIARDSKHLTYPEGPAVVMIDHDPLPGQAGLTAKQLRVALVDAVPQLRDVTALWLPSAGSYIWAGEEERIGLRGARLYFVVDRGTEIPRIAAALNARLALKGYGAIQFTRAGNMRERTPIDVAVYQAPRLDYAHAICGPGLDQRPIGATLFGPSEVQTMLRTESVEPLTAEESRAVAEIWKSLRTAAEPEAKRIRGQWASARARADAERLDHAPTEDWLQSRAYQYSQCAEALTLEPFHELKLSDGTTLTAAELVSDPQKYHGATLYDPFEPGYGGPPGGAGDKRIAMAVLNVQRPYITSFVHGGCRYDLSTPEFDFAGLDEEPAQNASIEMNGAATDRAALTRTAVAPVAPTGLSVTGGARGRRPAELPLVAGALRLSGVCGKFIGYDSFQAAVMLAEPSDEPQWMPLTDNDITRFREHLQLHHGFRSIPKELMRDAIAMVAHENRFDSAQTWLGRQVWDGVPRVDTFLHRYFGAADTPYTRAVSRYIWTALSGRLLKPGCKADMAPVAVGAQGTRKSTTIAAIAPNPDLFAEIALDVGDAETKRLMRGKVVIELAELSGMRKREAESMKAFLSTQADQLVEKYKEHAITLPRRSLFFGSSNRDDFLSDDTGHRRWLPFDAGQCDPEALERDRQQLWAEGRDLFNAGGVAHAAAERLGRLEHERYTETDEWAASISRWLRDGGHHSVTAHNVLISALSFTTDRVGEREVRRASGVLKSLGWRQERRMVDGVRQRVYLRP